MKKKKEGVVKSTTWDRGERKGGGFSGARWSIAWGQFLRKVKVGEQYIVQVSPDKVMTMIRAYRLGGPL